MTFCILFELKVIPFVSLRCLFFFWIESYLNNLAGRLVLLRYLISIGWKALHSFDSFHSVLDQDAN